MDPKNPIDQWLNESFEQPLPGGDKATLWDKVNAGLVEKKKLKKTDSKNPIDLWLKESFEQPLPGDTKAVLWDKVNASLNEKKKKRFAFWWWTAGIAVIAAASLIYCNFTKPNQSTVSKNNTETNSKIDSQNNPKSNSSETNDVDNKAKESNNTTSSSPDNSVLNQNDTKISGAEPRELNLDKPIKNKPIANPSTKKDNSTTAEDKGALPNTDKTPTLPTPVKNNTPNIISWADYRISPKATASQLADNSIHTLFDVPAIDWTLHRKKPTDRSTDPVFGMNPWTFGFNLGASPSKNIVNIAKNGLPFVHKNYLDIRKNGEQALFTTQFDFYIRKSFGNFFVQSSLSQFTRGFQQNYQYAIDEKPITTMLNGAQPDANGKYPLDPQLANPYIKDRTPELVNYQGKSTSSFTEIPLNIGYTFKVRKFAISPTFGAGVNFSKQTNSAAIDYQNLKLTTAKDLFTVFDKTNYSFNTGVLIERQLVKNLYIQAQPFYHRMIKGNTQTIQQNPISYGLNIGLNLKLHKDE